MVHNEKEIEIFSENVLRKIRNKIKLEIVDAFYDEMSDFLYGHYDNATNRTKKLSIKELVEEVNNDPKNISFRLIRNKIFSDNKDIFLEYITNEKIEEGIDKIIWKYENKEFPFSWGWKEYVIKHIENNLSKYAKSNMVLSKLNAKIETLTKQLTSSKELINELQNKTKEK